MNKNELKKILKNNRKLKITSSGIKGGCIGPMTVTNAHLEYNSHIEQEILNTLNEFGFYKKEDTITNGDLEFKLIWYLKRTHKGKEALIYDPSYQTYWAKILWQKTTTRQEQQHQ
jgi:hypothetical protein